MTDFSYHDYVKFLGSEPLRRLREEIDALLSVGSQCPPGPNPAQFINSAELLLENLKDQRRRLLQHPLESEVDFTNVASSPIAIRRQGLELVARENLVFLLDEECRHRGLDLPWNIVGLKLRKVPPLWRQLLDYVLPAFLQIWARQLKNVDGEKLSLEAWLCLFLIESERIEFTSSQPKDVPRSDTVETQDDASNIFPDQNYRTIQWPANRPRRLTTSQSAMVQLLRKRWIDGIPDVQRDELLKAANLPTSSDPRDTFRGTPNGDLWGDTATHLIIPGRERGTRRINLCPEDREHLKN